jgi:hypothetical protein
MVPTKTVIVEFKHFLTTAMSQWKFQYQWVIVNILHSYRFTSQYDNLNQYTKLAVTGRKHTMYTEKRMPRAIMLMTHGLRILIAIPRTEKRR